ncbi:hypothetical protein [Caulobacter segnis]
MTDAAAPGWKIQCVSCGHQKSLAEAGGVRVGGAGTSYTLGRCSQCRGFRILKVHRPSRP